MARTRAPKPPRSELKNISYEIFIGLLSIMSIVNIALEWLVKDQELQGILFVMNGLFSIIFLIDFTYRICTAPSAAGYFFRGFGWADLLASLPFAELKILRLFRVLRVLRLMRELGPRTIFHRVISDRANSALMTLLLMGVIVMQYGSLMILKVEEYAEGANIVNASDALWYTIVTISTVGYGDQYPVTNTGRMIGTIIIIVGVGIFGTFTGYLANLFLGPGKGEPAPAAQDADADADGTVSVTAEATSPEKTEAKHRHKRKKGLVDGSREGIAQAASSGVAAGGVSGAVKSGATAEPADGASPGDVAVESASSVDTARLEQLLEESESRIVEIRRMLADAR
ncbi:ion transporter [Microbacterium sp. ASV49]|uniref:Ion transporter n=1 Tax=Microbacterium candidum TaxID=3041922 RepID=A0ABT7MWH1_9MICO|nr:ion transporter [Microbacterium sp. ASV49]MDL9978803.1 ion transporter [Microbacterium sp. ASV49]